MSDWRVAINEQPVPISQTELETKYRTGEYSAETMVWHASIKDWKPLRVVFPQVPYDKWYFINQTQVQQGPFTAETIRGHLRKGVAYPQCYYWREGLPEWVQLERVLDLKHLLPEFDRDRIEEEERKQAEEKAQREQEVREEAEREKARAEQKAREREALAAERLKQEAADRAKDQAVKEQKLQAAKQAEKEAAEKREFEALPIHKKLMLKPEYILTITRWIKEKDTKLINKMAKERDEKGVPPVLPVLGVMLEVMEGGSDGNQALMLPTLQVLIHLSELSPEMRKFTARSLGESGDVMSLLLHPKQPFTGPSPELASRIRLFVLVLHFLTQEEQQHLATDELAGECLSLLALPGVLPPTPPTPPAATTIPPQLIELVGDITTALLLLGGQWIKRLKGGSPERQAIVNALPITLLHQLKNITHWEDFPWPQAFQVLLHVYTVQPPGNEKQIVNQVVFALVNRWSRVAGPGPLPSGSLGPLLEFHKHVSSRNLLSFVDLVAPIQGAEFFPSGNDCFQLKRFILSCCTSVGPGSEDGRLQSIAVPLFLHLLKLQSTNTTLQGELGECELMMAAEDMFEIMKSEDEEVREALKGITELSDMMARCLFRRWKNKSGCTVKMRFIRYDAQSHTVYFQRQGRQQGSCLLWDLAALEQRLIHTTDPLPEHPPSRQEESVVSPLPQDWERIELSVNTDHLDTLAKGEVVPKLEQLLSALEATLRKSRSGCRNIFLQNNAFLITFLRTLCERLEEQKLVVKERVNDSLVRICLMGLAVCPTELTPQLATIPTFLTQLAFSQGSEGAQTMCLQLLTSLLSSRFRDLQRGGEGSDVIAGPFSSLIEKLSPNLDQSEGIMELAVSVLVLANALNPAKLHLLSATLPDKFSQAVVRVLNNSATSPEVIGSALVLVAQSFHHTSSTTTNTGLLFYTNDCFVLMDVMCRLIADAPREPRIVLLYLRTLEQLLSWEEYPRHRYKLDIVQEIVRGALEVYGGLWGLEAQQDEVEKSPSPTSALFFQTQDAEHTDVAARASALLALLPS